MVCSVCFKEDKKKLKQIESNFADVVIHLIHWIRNNIFSFFFFVSECMKYYIRLKWVTL